MTMQECRLKIPDRFDRIVLANRTQHRSPGTLPLDGSQIRRQRREWEGKKKEQRERTTNIQEAIIRYFISEGDTGAYNYCV